MLTTVPEFLEEGRPVFHIETNKSLRDYQPISILYGNPDEYFVRRTPDITPISVVMPVYDGRSFREVKNVKGQIDFHNQERMALYYPVLSSLCRVKGYRAEFCPDFEGSMALGGGRSFSEMYSIVWPRPIAILFSGSPNLVFMPDEGEDVSDIWSLAVVPPSYHVHPPHHEGDILVGLFTGSREPVLSWAEEEYPVSTGGCLPHNRKTLSLFSRTPAVFRRKKKTPSIGVGRTSLITSGVLNSISSAAGHVRTTYPVLWEAISSHAD